MSTAPRYQPHYTIDDYQQWEGRWELWHGIAVAMSPSPRGPHAKLLARLVTALGNAIDAAVCDATVLVEIDWIVTKDTVFRPDITVVCGPEPAGHVLRPPALIVEVLSEATRGRDTQFKRDLYAAQGVAWYVIADPDAASVEVLSLRDDGYVATALPAAGESLTIELCSACRITFDPARLFR